MLADIYNGRIIIVNSGFKIIKDTFSLSEGKICISEETIRCFQGESTNKYNTEKHYFVLAIPITENVQTLDSKTPARTAGVMLVTASTESMLNLEESLREKAALYQLLVAVVILILSLTAVNMAMKPFDALVSSINRVAEGNLDEDIRVETYRETKRISGSLSRMLDTIRSVEKSRQEFVSNVSHELKTPITSIRVLVRMDKAAPETNIVSSDINRQVEMVLKRLRPIARKRNIELIFESMRDVTADIDEVKFSLAVNNLVENAIKYNKEDGWVRVTLDADHKFFYLKVADSGIGIPEEFKDRVFERFYRVDKARSRETGGTGLGLAITKSVILLHHGAVRVESREGEGTVFLVRIPLIYIP